MTRKIYKVKVDFTITSSTPKEAEKEVRDLLLMAYMPGSTPWPAKIRSIIEERVILE